MPHVARAASGRGRVATVGGLRTGEVDPSRRRRNRCNRVRLGASGAGAVGGDPRVLVASNPPASRCNRRSVRPFGRARGCADSPRILECEARDGRSRPTPRASPSRGARPRAGRRRIRPDNGGQYLTPPSPVQRHERRPDATLSPGAARPERRGGGRTERAAQFASPEGRCKAPTRSVGASAAQGSERKTWISRQRRRRGRSDHSGRPVRSSLATERIPGRIRIGQRDFDVTTDSRRRAECDEGSWAASGRLVLSRSSGFCRMGSRHSARRPQSTAMCFPNVAWAALVTEASGPSNDEGPAHGGRGGACDPQGLGVRERHRVADRDAGGPSSGETEAERRGRATAVDSGCASAQKSLETDSSPRPLPTTTPLPHCRRLLP